MIKWLFKYGAVVFLFNTIFLSIETTYFIGNQLFIGLMVLYSIALVINPIQIKNAIFHKAFAFLLVITIRSECLNASSILSIDLAFVPDSIPKLE